jgi:PPOX class probable F420-dependent enzyme
MLDLDLSTEFGARVARRLEADRIGWLTTVDHDQTPQPSPVWFLWDGESILIYSRPNTPKLRNIERNAHVAFNLDGNGQGGDIIVITGQARLDSSVPAADANPAYLAKYRESISRIGMMPATFAASYSVAIRLTPTKLRGH